MSLALYTRPGQSTISQRGWRFHALLDGVDPGDHRYRPRCVGAVHRYKVYRGISEPEMGPYARRVRRNCPQSVGLYFPRTALALIKLQTYQRLAIEIEVAIPCAGIVDAGQFGFRSHIARVEGVWKDVWTREGTLSSTGVAGSMYEPNPIFDQPMEFQHRWGWTQGIVYIVPEVSEL